VVVGGAFERIVAAGEPPLEKKDADVAGSDDLLCARLAEMLSALLRVVAESDVDAGVRGLPQGLSGPS